jgi:glycosyltransferase involved in cell wall biosynthesis
MNTPALFTVIVATHNRPLLLQRCLRSLIAQTFTNFQVIVVDDSAAYIPPFHELALLQGRYTHLIRSGGPSGPAHSRNMALALANSDYILFLDDDDTFEPGHLQALDDHMGGASPPLLFCSFTVVDEDRTTNPPQFLSSEIIALTDVTQDSVYVRNRIPNSCLIYRRDVLADVRHDTVLEIYEDWDFALQCLNKHKLQFVPIASVVIHKSRATAPENMRRGNTRDDLIGKVMLELYKRHPAPNEATRLARQSLMASAGITLAPGDC